MAAQVRVRTWGEGASLTIGQFCSLDPPITVMLGGEHHTEWISTYPFGHIYAAAIGVPPVVGHPTTRGDVVIGNDVWVGTESTIRSGVTIGDGAVIAAGSVVTGHVGPYEIFGGNPARKIRDRFDETTRDLLLRLRWWDLPLEEIRTLIPRLTAAPDADELRRLLDLYRER